ncbi:MAG: ribbon-helix-helix protein, CopG family [Gemmatimonadota bacterium]
MSFKLPKELDQMLTRVARRRGVSRAAVLRDALERYRAAGFATHGSLLELAGDLVGRFKGGPKDVSTNPKYMEGFGEE